MSGTTANVCGAGGSAVAESRKRATSESREKNEVLLDSNSGRGIMMGAMRHEDREQTRAFLPSYAGGMLFLSEGQECRSGDARLKSLVLS